MPHRPCVFRGYSPALYHFWLIPPILRVHVTVIHPMKPGNSDASWVPRIIPPNETSPAGPLILRSIHIYIYMYVIFIIHIICIYIYCHTPVNHENGLHGLDIPIYPMSRYRGHNPTPVGRLFIPLLSKKIQGLIFFNNLQYLNIHHL